MKREMLVPPFSPARAVGTPPGQAGEAIRTISHETTDTVLTINETADHLAKYALVIGEIVKTIVNMFSSNEKVVK